MREKIVSFFKSENKTKLIVAAGVLGIVLILLSDMLPSDSAKSSSGDNAVDYSAYVEELEQRTREILSSIDGAGKCSVMITLSDTNESVYAKNTTESGGSGNYSNSDEYVLYDGADGDTPVLIKQYFPKIQGVVIVCEGGDDKIVREKIISSVSSLFGVASNNITVSKLKE